MTDSSGKFSNLTKDNRNEESVELSVLSPAVLYNIHEKSSKHDIQHEVYNRQASYKKRASNHRNIEESLNYLKHFQPEMTEDGQYEAIRLRLIIDEEFNKSDLSELSSIFRDKSIVLMFFGKIKKQFLIYWKIADMDYFLRLKDFKLIAELDYTNFYEFIGDYLLNMVRQNYIGLRVDHNYNQQNNEVDLNDLFDYENGNLLQNAAENGDIEVVKIMIQHPNMKFSADIPYTPFSPQALALKNKHFDVFLTLLKAGFTYPLCLVINDYPDEVKEFIKIGNDMHSAIESKNKKKVIEILTKYPKQKHYYNVNEANNTRLMNKDSALYFALKKKHFGIYKILLVNGVEFGPHEDDFSFLSDNEKEDVTDIHIKHSKDLPNSHINILVMNTSVSYDDKNYDDKQHYIMKTYNVLNQIPIVKVILQAVAASKNFKIIFDFKRDSVHMIDLTSGKNAKGVFNSSRSIVVGAKQLMDPATEYETFGTLAHELCHYALDLTYKNRCKPYKEDDIERIDKFEGISRICEQNKECEKLIELVYSKYNNEERHAELAVRAVHLTTLYDNQREKLAKSKNDYPDMFDYYENTVVPEITAELPRIRKDAQGMSRIKIVSICAIISLILMGLLSWVLFSFLYVPNYNYAKLSEYDQERVKNATVIYKNVEVVLRNVYPKNSKIYYKLTSDHITKIFKNQKLNLNLPYFTYLTNAIFFSWLNMTKPLKDKFLSSKIQFQNENVSLSLLHGKYPGAFNSLTSKQIITVLDGKVPLSIGKTKEMSVKFYIERKFIPENSIIAYQNYNSSSNKTIKEFYESYSKERLKKEFKIYTESQRSHVGNSVAKISEFQAISQLINVIDFHKSEENVIKMVENSRLFVLSSEAGAGKTVTFEHLAIKLKQMNPTKWVYYVDLKDFVRFYEGSYENALLLLGKILDLTVNNEFEKMIFESSFKSNNSIILWNSFDEISPLYSDFILNVTKHIYQNTNNIQYICTRPLYSGNISGFLNVDPYILVPFNEIEQNDFLTKYYESQNINNNTDITKKVKEVMKLITKLIHDKNRKYDSPLLLSMLAEIDITKINFYEIFNNFVKKKIEIFNSKNSTVGENVFLFQGDSHSNYFKVCQQFSMINDIFPFAFSTHPGVSSLDIFQKVTLDPKYYPDFSRAGILYINDKTKFEFAHKTFAEFFIAQYLVDKIYKEDNSLTEKEFDGRLEMFFLTIQYSNSFEKVIEFVREFLKNPENQNPFHETIRKILMKKYKKHLIYILNKPYKESFQFFFEFFKKDKELMLDLLKVNEPETFYTALFNPFYMATNLNPEVIKNVVRHYLTDDEFKNFTNGQHQKVVILYGQFERKEFDELKTQNLSISNETSFWDFYGMIKSNLSQEELEQMFLNPIVTFIYRKHSTTEKTNEKFWTEVSSLFKQEKIPEFIGNMLPQLFRPKLEISNDVEIQSLDMLIKRTELILNSTEIHKMALNTHLIFRSARSFPQLQIVWDFIVRHTSLEQRKELLTYDFRFNKSIHEQKFYSMYYKFFVMTPMVLHVNMFADNFTDSINFSEKIYRETFNQSEIRGFFNASNNFLFPLIFTRPIEACEKFSSLLESLYQGGHEIDLVRLIEREFNDTKLTIFEYFDKMLAFAFQERENVRKKLKIFSDLRDKLKKKNS